MPHAFICDAVRTPLGRLKRAFRAGGTGSAVAGRPGPRIVQG
jgi:hypothetical protein